MPVPATAGLVKKCRKACKPFVAECVAASGKSRRTCKREILPRCKHEGLQVCSVTTTTTPTTGGGATTTTTAGPSGKGGGAMSLDVNDLSVQPDGDQSLYTMSITIEYSVVTFDAVTQVALDPATFTVLDEDTGIVYQAEPAGAPEDCSADDVLSKDGPAVTCTPHFARTRSSASRPTKTPRPSLRIAPATARVAPSPGIMPARHSASRGVSSGRSHMDQMDVAVIVGAAAAGAALVVVGFMRGSRTPDEGLRRLRLLLNVILLGFYYATFGVALALFGLGLIHHDTNYWFGAMAFLLVALLLFRDMSATRSNPLREWFSRAPMSERVRGLQEDTRSLLGQLSDEIGSEGPLRDDSVATGHATEETRADGTRTWAFEFHWPPRKRGS